MPLWALSVSHKVGAISDYNVMREGRLSGPYAMDAPLGRKTAPLWARLGSPAPPGTALSLAGTGGARKASLPPG